MEQKEQISQSELDDCNLQDVQGGLSRDQGVDIGLGAGLGVTSAATAGAAVVGAKRIKGLRNKVSRLSDQVTNMGGSSRRATSQRVSPTSNQQSESARARREQNAAHPIR